MEERKGFSFLRSFYEAARSLKTKELQADFLMAICDYALNGEEPELPDEVKTPFILVKPILENSRKRAKAGVVGGQKSKKTESKNEKDEPKSKSKTKPNERKNEAKNNLLTQDVKANSNLLTQVAKAERTPLNRSKEIGDRSKEIENINIPQPYTEGAENSGDGGGYSAEALEIFKIWESRFGTVSSFRATTLVDLLNEYGKDVAIYAIKEAYDHGASGWDYVKAVARNETRRREQNGLNRVSTEQGNTDVPALRENVV